MDLLPYLKEKTSVEYTKKENWIIKMQFSRFKRANNRFG